MTNFVYDSENRLTQMNKAPNTSSPPTSTASYKYDGLGRRIQKDVDGVVTTYIYDRENIRLEYDGSGSLEASYVFGTRIDEPLIMSRGGASYLYNTDSLGSVRYLMDQSGAIAESYAYDAFGNRTVFNASGVEIQPSAGIKNPFGYTGREEDIENPGQKYYRARYYSSYSGRFLSQDPIGYASGDPNYYRAMNNNPLRFTDPDGLTADDVEKAVQIVQRQYPNVSYNKVDFTPDPRLNGKYDRETGHIYVSTDFLEKLSIEKKVLLLDTVFHEAEHSVTPKWKGWANGLLYRDTDFNPEHQRVRDVSFQNTLDNLDEYLGLTQGGTGGKCP